MSRRKDIRRLAISAYASPHHGNPAAAGTRPNHGPATQHHLIPRSRGGPTKRENLLEVPQRIHQAWHYLFGNMTPEQVILYIATHWSPADYFDEIQLGHGRQAIRCGHKELARLASLSVDRFSVPAFTDVDHNFFVRQRRNKAERRGRQLGRPSRH